LDTYGNPPKPPQGNKIPEPSDDDLRRYDLEILDLSRGMDEEEIDEIEVD